MPKISQKAIDMPASPIRKLVPYAEQAKKEGKKVYHLNIGQPDIQTPQIALDAIKNFNNKVIEYSHSAGFESYRVCAYTINNRFSGRSKRKFNFNRLDSNDRRNCKPDY